MVINSSVLKILTIPLTPTIKMLKFNSRVFRIREYKYSSHSDYQKVRVLSSRMPTLNSGFLAVEEWVEILVPAPVMHLRCISNLVEVQEVIITLAFSQVAVDKTMQTLRLRILAVFQASFGDKIGIDT